MGGGIPDHLLQPQNTALWYCGWKGEGGQLLQLKAAKEALSGQIFAHLLNFFPELV